MAFDDTSPATGHQALSDIDQIRNNLIELRQFEKSTSAPTNPVEGMLWWKDNGDGSFSMYQYTGGAWTSKYLWKSTDLPAKKSELDAHTGANITSAVAVHGIKQGSGNGLDADMVDGSHASAFAPASHTSATSNVHGVGNSTVESTDGAQAKVDAHAGRTDNPHNVTAAQIGAMSNENGAVSNDKFPGYLAAYDYQVGASYSSTSWGLVASQQIVFNKTVSSITFKVGFTADAGSAGRCYLVFNGVQSPERNSGAPPAEWTETFTGPFTPGTYTLEVWARIEWGTGHYFYGKIKILKGLLSDSDYAY